MKTTFKKTLAALSAAAVVAASAAVFAVPTDAAGYGTITVDTVYITVDDAGSKVNVPVCSFLISSIGISSLRSSLIC